MPLFLFSKRSNFIHVKGCKDDLFVFSCVRNRRGNKVRADRARSWPSDVATPL